MTASYTDNHVDTAQCLWEYITTNRHRPYITVADKECGALLEYNGTCAVRQMCRGIDLLNGIDVAYEYAKKELEDFDTVFPSYDWNFIPWFFQNCLTFDKHVSVAPDWKTKIDAYKQHDNALGD